MFKLVKNLTVWWPVKVMEPDPERPGSFVEQEFEVELEILDRDENKKRDELRAGLLKAAAADPSEENLKKIEGELEAFDDASFKRVIRNWRHIIDDDRAPIPFTNENFSEALKLDRVRVGLHEAYQGAISQDKARLKN